MVSLVLQLSPLPSSGGSGTRQAEQQRRNEERKAEYERQRKEFEAEQKRREKLSKARTATFDRILDNAPAMFTAAQLRIFLRLLVHIDPYSVGSMPANAARCIRARAEQPIFQLTRSPTSELIRRCRRQADSLLLHF